MSYLPTPPTEAEKLAYVNPRGAWLGWVGVLSLISFCVLTVRSFHPNLFYWVYVVFAALYVARVAFWAIGSWFARPFDYEQHCRDRESHKTHLPSVDVFLPSCGEPIDVIANQFKAVRDLDYPNYTAWVLDDKGSDQVRMLAELHGFEYLSRPDKGRLKKAGNLRYGFARSHSDLILVLDADFVPRSDFLRETVFRFAQNPKLAILQTPQYFGNHEHQQNQTDIQLGLGFFQEAFYRLVQVFRDRLGAAICCGSCAIYRREALAPHGGGAPVERSEDVHTGWMLLSEGWQIEYLPLNLSAGLSPEGIKQLFNQHYRWCSGSYSLTYSNDFWAKPKIGWAQKWIYYSAFHYYTTSALGTLLHAIPVFLGLWIAPDVATPIGYRFGIPAILLVLISSALWSNSRWGLFVPKCGLAVSYTHLIALFDVVLGDIAPWVPSGISSSNGKFDRFVLAVSIVPPLLLAIALSICVVQDVNGVRSLFPLLWMSLQVLTSWLVLGEIYQEMPLFEQK